MIELLHPLWGWAIAAAVGAPLLAHLLSQRGGRLAAFPATRFVAQASADVAKWLRPRHWLMLLLRILILALVAAAFMQPIWRRQAPATTHDQGVLTALILDRSASMMRSEHGVQLFDQAKQKTIDTLKGLDPQIDLATVILLDADPRPMLPEPTAGFSNLIRMIEALEPTPQRGDLVGALSTALAETAPGAQVQLDELGRVRKVHIEVFSDLQHTQIEALTRSAPVLDRARLRLHQFGPAQQTNLAVYAPTLRPVRPILGQTAAATVQTANFSDQTVETTLMMTHAGQSRRQTLRLGPWGVGSVSFPFLPTQLGAQSAVIELSNQADAWNVDNRTEAAFTVDAARPVALVSDADFDNPQSAAFYFARALRPESEADVDPTVNPRQNLRLSGVSLARWKPAQLVAGLQGAGRAQPDAIVLVEAASIDPTSLKLLHRYLKAGGAVLWVIDSAQSADNLMRFNQLAGGAIAPIAPDIASSWRPNSNLMIASGAFDHNILSVFEGPARTAVVNSRFRATLAGKAPTAADVLLTFEDGTPALATSWIGSGRLAVFAADAAPKQSDFVKGPLLVSLLHQLLRHLSPGRPALPNPHPGDQPTIAVDIDAAGTPLTIHTPDGAVASAPITAINGSQTFVQSPRLETIGRYDLQTSGGDGRLLQRVYVELDPAESNLRQADERTLAALQIDDKEVLADNGVADESALLRPQGAALWPWLMLAAAMLMIAEPLLLALLAGPTSAAAPIQ